MPPLTPRRPPVPDADGKNSLHVAAEKEMEASVCVVYVCMYVCMQVCGYMLVGVGGCGRMHVSVCICMYVCICMLYVSV